MRMFPVLFPKNIKHFGHANITVCSYGKNKTTESH